MSTLDAKRIFAIQEQLERQRQGIFGATADEAETAGASSTDSGNKSNTNGVAYGFPRSATMKLILRNPDLIIWLASALARKIGIAPWSKARSTKQVCARLVGTLCYGLIAIKSRGADCRCKTLQTKPPESA